MLKLFGLLCLPAVCYGRSAPSPLFQTGRVVGGFEVDITSAPHQLALEWNGIQYMAASLISERFALTAGHCVSGLWADEMKIRTGSADRHKGGKVIQVKKTYLIDKYNITDTFVDYDVGLLELEEPVTLGPTSYPIPLADAEPLDGEVFAAGWGKTMEGGVQSEELLGLIMPVVPRATCVENYEGYVITPRMFCAGAEGRSTCQGDSGGAVVRDGKQVGIVSWGLGCGRPGLPMVYTNVAHPEVRAFIQSIAGV